MSNRIELDIQHFDYCAIRIVMKNSSYSMSMIDLSNDSVSENYHRKLREGITKGTHHLHESNWTTN